ncbi:hypothetical protein HVE01_25200 [Vreelandella venusta]|nr:hypothetical protein HVE01_25200 [Halomonas venusta]
MLLAFQLWFLAKVAVVGRLDYPGTTVWQFPVYFRLFNFIIKFFGFSGWQVFTRLIQTGHTALALKPSHTVNYDERNQCQS